MPSTPGRWKSKKDGSWIPSARAMLSRVFTRLAGRRRRTTIAIIAGIIILSLYVSVTHFSEMEELARSYRQSPSPEKAIPQAPPAAPPPAAPPPAAPPQAAPQGVPQGAPQDAPQDAPQGAPKLRPPPPPPPPPPPAAPAAPPAAPQLGQRPLMLPPISYGTNARPAFKGDTTFIADLPSNYIPYFSDSETDSASSGTAKRLIVIGDVHGQLDTLKKLLEQVNFDNKNGDHLIFTGDLINKGPNSPGVVQLAMDLGASAVRGNHEDRALLLYATENTNSKNAYPKDKLEKTVEDALAVARSLTDAQREWLSSLPVILRIGRIPGSGFSPPPWNAGDILVVHGGLVPSLPVHKQDPWGVMNMRSLKYPIDETFRQSVRRALERAAKSKSDKLNKPIEEFNKKEEEHATNENRKPNLKKKIDPQHITDDMVEQEMSRQRAMNPGSSDLNENYFITVPNDARDGEPWSNAWNRVENSIENEAERSIVIYGHDAKAGLQADLSIDIFAKPLNLPPSNRNKDKSKPLVVDDEDYLNDEDLKREHVLRQEKTKKIGKGTRYAFGLDSGAGKGGKLTALIIETSPAPGGSVVVHHSIQQVDVV